MKSGGADEKSAQINAENLGKKFVEYVLWLGRGRCDVVKEIDYVYGITIKTLRIRYPNFDIEVRSSTRTGFAEALNILERVLPLNIVSAIARNVERAHRILSITRSLL